MISAVISHNRERLRQFHMRQTVAVPDFFLSFENQTLLVKKEHESLSQSEGKGTGSGWHILHLHHFNSGPSRSLQNVDPTKSKRLKL